MITVKGTARDLGGRRSLCAVAVLLTLAVWSRGVACEPLLSEVLENPEVHRGNRVVVTGIVTTVTRRVSKTGDPYYALNLTDGTRTVTVLGSGPPPCSLGTSARVSGTVDITTSSGRTRAVINAADVTCLSAKAPATPHP